MAICSQLHVPSALSIGEGTKNVHECCVNAEVSSAARKETKTLLSCSS